MQERSLRQAYSISPKTFKAVVTILDKQCDGIAEQIKTYFKTPMKSAMRPQTRTRTASTTAFPETPTKKRRVDSSSPTKPRTSGSPAKRSSAVAIAAFHAALKGSPTKLPAGQESESPGAGPSTPRRSQRTKVAEVTVTPMQADSQPSPMQADSQPSPSRSQWQALPTRPAVRRRFRPVFLEQQQWCARDPKVEQIWAVAKTRQDPGISTLPVEVA